MEASVFLVIGLCLGWIVAYFKMRHHLTEARQQGETEIAILTERLAGQNIIVEQAKERLLDAEQKQSEQQQYLATQPHTSSLLNSVQQRIQ